MMNGDSPLFSIVTVNLNDKLGLEKTITSVFQQSISDFEFIIIDGGSEDGSVELIKKNESRLGYWVSERDGGISEAFNKGVQVCRGKFINFLNSGDAFFNNQVLEKVSNQLSENISIYTGFSKFGQITIPKTKLFNYQKLYLKSRISHQASFVEEKVFRELGVFSEDYRVRMDYEFWMRALSKYEFHFIDEVLVEYDEDGVSGKNLSLFYAEEIRVNRKYLSLGLFWLRSILIFLARIYKFILR